MRCPRSVTRAALAAVCALACAAPRAIHAQEGDPGDHVDPVVDGAITAGLLTGMALVSLIPVDTSTRWHRQLFGSVDDSVKDNFSASAAAQSDSLLALTMLTPALLQLPRGLDAGTGRRLLLFACATASSGVPLEWAAVPGRAGVALLPDLSDAMAYCPRISWERTAGDHRSAENPNTLPVQSPVEHP